jgi:hypothetical protein
MQTYTGGLGITPTQYSNKQPSSGIALVAAGMSALELEDKKVAGKKVAGILIMDLDEAWVLLLPAHV